LSTKYDLELYRLKADLCRVFCDPTRLIIISELRGSEKTVGDLVKILEVPQAAVSRHLGILRHGGMVTPRHEGTSVYYRLNDSRIAKACDLVHEILLNQIEKNGKLARKLAG